MRISLYPHQIKAINDLRPGSILCGGVGSGKSRTSIAYYFCRICGGDILSDGTLVPMKKPKDLYIITTARKRDTLEWESECLPFGIANSNSQYNINFKVDSWNNIKKYSEIKNAFFIFDEQRVVGSGTWVKAFLKISKSNEWILLSATPGDTWSDYIPVFVANGFYKNRTEFLKRHAVFNRFTKYPKIDRYVDCRRLEKLRDKITVVMPFEKHTKRNVIDIFTDYNEELYSIISKDRWNPYEERPIKDISEVCYVMRKAVNSDLSRIEETIRLISKHKKVIVFYNFDYELELLRTMCFENHIPWGEWNGHNHQSIPEDDMWVYLVQYTAGAEGWNCIKTDTIIFYSLNYSYKIMEQASGRIDRMNTPFFNLYYYRLRSRSSIDSAIFKTLCSKKTFNEKNFISF